MKKNLLIIALLICGSISAQNFKNIFVKELPFGTANDSIVVWDGATKQFKYVAQSSLVDSSINNLLGWSDRTTGNTAVIGKGVGKLTLTNGSSAVVGVDGVDFTNTSDFDSPAYYFEATVIMPDGTYRYIAFDSFSDAINGTISDLFEDEPYGTSLGEVWDLATGNYEYYPYMIGKASGELAFTSGYGNIASALTSTAIGQNNNVSNSNAIALGTNNIVSGEAAFAAGAFNQALGSNSVALGTFAESKGNASFAFNTIAESFAEITFGFNPTLYTPISSSVWELSDRLFNIGNGTSTEFRSDAFTILKNASVGIDINNFEAFSTTAKLNVNGTIRGTTYGSGTNTGTATYSLAVDADGYIIEETLATGTIGGSITQGQIAFGAVTDNEIEGSSNFNFNAGTLTTGNGTDNFALIPASDIIRFTENSNGGAIGNLLFNPPAASSVTWTLPSSTGTIALTSDITGTNSGTNTGDQTIFTVSASGYSAINYSPIGGTDLDNHILGIDTWMGDLDNDISNLTSDLSDKINLSGTPTVGQIGLWVNGTTLEGTNKLLATDATTSMQVTTSYDRLEFWAGGTGGGNTYIQIRDDESRTIIGGDLIVTDDITASDDVTAADFIDSNGTTSTTGTALSLSDNITGTLYNVATPSAATTYTTTGAKTGGYAVTYINTTSQPTVTGATLRAGATWVTGTDMKMVVYTDDGTNVFYYFLVL